MCIHCTYLVFNERYKHPKSKINLKYDFVKYHSPSSASDRKETGDKGPNGDKLELEVGHCPGCHDGDLVLFETRLSFLCVYIFMWCFSPWNFISYLCCGKLFLILQGAILMLPGL